MCALFSHPLCRLYGDKTPMKSEEDIRCIQNALFIASHWSTHTSGTNVVSLCSFPTSPSCTFQENRSEVLESVLTGSVTPGWDATKLLLFETTSTQKLGRSQWSKNYKATIRRKQYEERHEDFCFMSYMSWRKALFACLITFNPSKEMTVIRHPHSPVSSVTVVLTQIFDIIG